MTNKEKVRTGKDYWYIGFPEMYVESCMDSWRSTNNDDYNYGNYFHTKEEAEAMAKKLRAVLNGAEAIEIPSEEKIEEEAYENNHIHKERGDCNYPDDLCIEYFIEGVKWLKSKIVK